MKEAYLSGDNITGFCIKGLNQMNMRVRYSRVPNSTSNLEEGTTHQNSEKESDVKIVRLDTSVSRALITFFKRL